MPDELRLSPHDQSSLDSALEHLLADGLVWRAHEADRRAYNALARWPEAAEAQLHGRGWRLTHHESARVYQAVHARGKHRRSLKRDTALALLVCRLLYVETPAGLTPHPVVSLAEIAARCAGLSLQLDLPACLVELAALKLIRPAGGKTLRPTDSEQLVELLPTLTVVVPDAAIDKAADSNSRATQPEPPARS